MRRNVIRIAIILGILAITLSLHYLILPMPAWLHQALHQADLHRRLCYIPIILGALWFGLRGGVLTAAVISEAVLPLALRFQGPLLSNADFVEIVFYLAIGVLAGTLVDMKDRERAKKERLEHELESAERMAALGRASAGIAHEVRTPLGSIQGAAEILAEDFPSDHPHRPFFDILSEECRRLGRVVDDFLDLSRPISLDREEVSPGALLAAAFEAVRSLAETRGVRLELQGEAGGRPLSLDPHRVRQALVNLVLNAVQSCSEGGVVRGSVRTERGWIEYGVSDSGPGIAPEDEDRIFEPFFTRRKDGTGLGLPLARQVAAAHGGSLSARSGPEGGAVFVMSIPFVEAWEGPA